MKKNLRITGCLAIAAMAQGQNVTGPSSSQTPFMEPVAPGVKFTSVITAGDQVNGYTACGILDGAGAWDNGDGTFTFLVNHEFGSTSGAVRAHGQTGAFVSKWIINKDDLKVISGADLIQRIYLWNGSSYTMHNPTNPSSNARTHRFCSGDLPAVSAFYNEATGKGTMNRIFMNGEEAGSEGRAFGHVASGPDAGSTYELPYLGKFSWENSVANPGTGDKTVVAGTDDAGGGQVYIYIGDKKTSGLDIEKAGLTGGKLYGIAVNGYVSESNGTIPAAGTTFSLYDLGDVSGMTGSTINTNSNNNGVTGFQRPEDGLWDPQNPTDLYVLTTNSFSSPSRMWRFRFTDINDLTKGGTVEAVCDGTEGQHMFDNMGIDNFGHIIIQEDPGGNSYNARIWQYDIATDKLTEIAKHDPARFETGGASFLTTNEEASGMFDAQEILGAGWFLLVDQAHTGTGVSSEVGENGQILAMFNPDSYASNPEISVEGNSTDIPNGTSNPEAANGTDFGTTATGTTVTKTFEIKNAGPADLVIDGISIGGANASEFTPDGFPSFPLTIAANSAQSIKIKFAPTTVGLRKANVMVESNDFDESEFDFAIQGVGLNPADVENTSLSQYVKLYPNPTRDMATVAINLAQPQTVAITVVSMNGKIVAAPIQQKLGAGEQKVNVSTANLPNGNYYVVISSGEEITKVQLVVAH